MKFKKHILKFALLAGILACLLVAGSMFASGTDVATEESGLNIVVTAPSTAVAEGNTFVVSVKLANEDVAATYLAGLQVELAYDSETLSVQSITHELDETESTAVSNDTANSVKFVCVKNEFNETAGYSTLGALFNVTFTAKKDIANPAALFDNDDITYLMGDVTAMEIVNSNAVYGADKEKIALAILASDLNLVVTESYGTIVVAPTPEANALPTTKSELNLTNATIDKDVVGTGATITADSETATVVVKGDVDGDGVVTVFDSLMIKKALDANADEADKFADNDIKEYAADFNNSNATDNTDASAILTYTLG